MSTQVVTVTNRVPNKSREPYYHFDKFIDSLRRFNVDPTVLGMNEWWGGLMTKPRRLRQWLRGGNCNADTLIVSDSFDVIFTAHPDDVAKAWNGNSTITFNAERGLFPRGDLAFAFPDKGTPWRYLNSGLFIGKPAMILALLESMNLDDIADDYTSPDDLHGGEGRRICTNDQGWYQVAYAMQATPMSLDWGCHIFQTMHGSEASDFWMEGGAVKNRTTHTQPLVFHFNGDSKDKLLPTFLEYWKL